MPGWFAITMGLCGLSLAWARAVPAMGELAGAIAMAMGVLARLLFGVLGGLSLLRAQRDPQALAEDLRHPIRHAFVAAVPASIVLLATVAYWTVLVDSHRTQRNFTEAQSWLRVGQMSHAVSVQVQTLLSGLDYTMRGLESDFADGDADGFRRAVQTTFDAYPAGTFLQIAVADESGDIVYSNLQQDAQTRAAKVSIRADAP